MRVGDSLGFEWWGSGRWRFRAWEGGRFDGGCGECWCAVGAAVGSRPVAIEAHVLSGRDATEIEGRERIIRASFSLQSGSGLRGVRNSPSRDVGGKAGAFAASGSLANRKVPPLLEIPGAATTDNNSCGSCFGNG